ncbi:MAG: ABC-2 transporter permease [Propionibacteriaceae bacterium]|jgi:hypothetical protein|nr:ABC-2 transporter permease [Propionibacteriaceae bacterium]
MIRPLICKEFDLAIPRANYCWLAAVVLLLIPNWPFVVVFSYLFFGFMLIVVQTDKVNHDLMFCASLPIPKSGAVTARAMTLILVEAAMVVLAIPFAIARFWLYDHDNVAGMNVNLTFFGLIFVMFAVFNVIYLPGAYKRAYRMLWPLLGGTLIAMGVGGTLTVAVSVVPALTVLNDRGLDHIGLQLIVLVAGVAIWGGMTWLAWRKAVSNYESVDL